MGLESRILKLKKKMKQCFSYVPVQQGQQNTKCRNSKFLLRLERMRGYPSVYKGMDINTRM
jgi:hypothetical protein